MDDTLVFGGDKEQLHRLRREISNYLWEELKLTLKENWQVFPTYVRGVDFVGYRVFMNYTLLRKSSCIKFKGKMTEIRKKTEAGQLMNRSDWCSIHSYKGWLKHCDSFRLSQKYLAPVLPNADRFYNEIIKPKKGGQKHDKLRAG